MLNDNELNINSTERQLLYDIRQELRILNKLLTGVVNSEPKTTSNECDGKKPNGHGAKRSNKRKTNNGK